MSSSKSKHSHRHPRSCHDRGVVKWTASGDDFGASMSQPHSTKHRGRPRRAATESPSRTRSKSMKTREKKTDGINSERRSARNKTRTKNAQATTSDTTLKKRKKNAKTADRDLDKSDPNSIAARVRHRRRKTLMPDAAEGVKNATVVAVETQRSAKSQQKNGGEAKRTPTVRFMLHEEETQESKVAKDDNTETRKRRTSVSRQKTAEENGTPSAKELAARDVDKGVKLADNKTNERGKEVVARRKTMDAKPKSSDEAKRTGNKMSPKNIEDKESSQAKHDEQENNIYEKSLATIEVKDVGKDDDELRTAQSTSEKKTKRKSTGSCSIYVKDDDEKNAKLQKLNVIKRVRIAENVLETNRSASVHRPPTPARNAIAHAPSENKAQEAVQAKVEHRMREMDEEKEDRFSLNSKEKVENVTEDQIRPVERYRDHVVEGDAHGKMEGDGAKNREGGVRLTEKEEPQKLPKTLQECMKTTLQALKVPSTSSPASSIRCFGPALQSMVAGFPNQFTVVGCNPIKLTTQINGMATVVLNQMHSGSAATFACTVAHRSQYRLELHSGDRPLPGSPFSFRSSPYLPELAPESVTVEGLDDDAQYPISQEIVFSIRAPEDQHNLRVSVFDGRGDEMCLRISEEEVESEQRFSAAFRPISEGFHFVYVTVGGVATPDSPYVVHVVPNVQYASDEKRLDGNNSHTLEMNVAKKGISSIETLLGTSKGGSDGQNNEILAQSAKDDDQINVQQNEDSVSLADTTVFPNSTKASDLSNGSSQISLPNCSGFSEGIRICSSPIAEDEPAIPNNLSSHDVQQTLNETLFSENMVLTTPNNSNSLGILERPIGHDSAFYDLRPLSWTDSKQAPSVESSPEQCAQSTSFLGILSAHKPVLQSEEQDAPST